MANQVGKKRWRLEATNPDEALWGLSADDPRTLWKPLWTVDEDQLIAAQELRDELNIINAPVMIRIVRAESPESPPR